MSTTPYPCYYCGKDSHYVCDYQLHVEQWRKQPEGHWEIYCNRNICAEHTVTDIAGYALYDTRVFIGHLCKEHAVYQAPSPVPVAEGEVLD